MSGAMIQERCPKCFGTWHRPLPLDKPAALMAALGLDRQERLHTPPQTCEGCRLAE
jgi:hypothetical protein